MRIEELGQSIRFHLRNIAYLRFDTDSEYSNVISPFSRLYLITKGEGHIIIEGKKIHLRPNQLYLVPSFTACSYFFGKELEHYYIHLSMETNSGLTVYQLFSVENKIAACVDDLLLFRRLLELNPDLQLPHHDPKVYQTKLWMNKKVNYQSVGHFLETQGILQQLFSRFLQNETCCADKKMPSHSIRQVLKYISDNLTNDVKMEDLAKMACISKDHFTRQFKSVTGMPPSEFIIRKRIEKAQLFLLTTDFPLSQIIEMTGFKATAYFCRLFKQHTGFTPLEYRKKRE